MTPILSIIIPLKDWESERLLLLLNSIRFIQKYNEISKTVFKEYVDEEMIKYEYWLDSPFRTKMRLITKTSNDERELLDFLYNTTPENND